MYNTIYNSLTSVWDFVKDIWDKVVNAFNDIWSKIPFIGSQAGVSGSYATGTNYVPETGIYMLHQGEAVIPASRNMNGGGSSITIQNVNLSADYPYSRFKRDVERQQRVDIARRGASV